MLAHPSEVRRGNKQNKTNYFMHYFISFVQSTSSDADSSSLNNQNGIQFESHLRRWASCYRFNYTSKWEIHSAPHGFVQSSFSWNASLPCDGNCDCAVGRLQRLTRMYRLRTPLPRSQLPAAVGQTACHCYADISVAAARLPGLLGALSKRSANRVHVFRTSRRRPSVHPLVTTTVTLVIFASAPSVLAAPAGKSFVTSAAATERRLTSWNSCRETNPQSLPVKSKALFASTQQRLQRLQEGRRIVEQWYHLSPPTSRAVYDVRRVRHRSRADTSIDKHCIVVILPHWRATV